MNEENDDVLILSLSYIISALCGSNNPEEGIEACIGGRKLIVTNV